MAVPTVAAGQSFAAVNLGTTSSALDQATGKQVAKGTDAGSAALTTAALATAEVPLLSVPLEAASTTLTITSMVLDPSLDHAKNLATFGLFGVGKALTAETKGEKVVETVEKAQQVSDVVEEANKLDEEGKPHSNE